jgi:glycosyltransferase involved in cell wall biosynthesis
MVVRHANSVVCVTDRHTALLREFYPELPSTKFVTIPNGFDGDEWETVVDKSAQRSRARNDKFIITYSGTLYMKRNPLPVFRALRALADSGDIALDQIRVDLVGDCSLAEGQPVTKIARECGVGNCVHVTGVLSRQETLHRVNQSNLLLLFAEGWTLQVPAKTYEYLRSGRPILALTSHGSLVELLRQTGGAWVADPTDATGIAAALREAYRCWVNGLPGPAPDPAVVGGFDRRVLAGRFAEVFESSLVEAFA